MYKNLFGTVVVAAVLLSLAGCGSSGLSDSQTFGLVGNNPPEVFLREDTEGFDAGAAEPFAPNAIVTDDQVSLDGGGLSLTFEEGFDGAFFDVDKISPIGVVTGDRTSRVFVSLDRDASPSAVQEFLRSAAIARRPDGASGSGTVVLTLSDGPPFERNETVVRLEFESVISVGPGEDQESIADALELVEATGNQNAIIEVAGDYVEPAGFQIRRTRSHDGIKIRGGTAGMSCGTVPTISSFSRLTKVVGLVTVDARDVTFDGLFFETSGRNNIEVLSGTERLTIINCGVSFTGTAGSGSVGVLVPSPATVTLERSCLYFWDTAVWFQGSADARFKFGSIIENAFLGNDLGLLVTEPEEERAFDLFIQDNGFAGTKSKHVRVQSSVATSVFVTKSHFAPNGAIVEIDGPIVLDTRGSWWGGGEPTSPDQFVTLNGGVLEFGGFPTRPPFPPFPPRGFEG